MTTAVGRLRSQFLLATLAAVLAGCGASSASSTEVVPIASGANPDKGPVAKRVSEFRESFDVGGLDFSPDGEQIAVNAALVGPDVHIWSWRDRPSIVRTLALPLPTDGGRAIVYNPAGTLLAVGHERSAPGSEIIRIWNPKTGALVTEIAEAGGASGVMGLGFSSCVSDR